MSANFGWYLAVVGAQCLTLTLALRWLARKQRANSPVRSSQKIAWMVLFTVLLVVQWWLSLRS